MSDEEPTPSQRAVIDLPHGTRALVIAGPGAGKTWALLQRAVSLIDGAGIQTSELLVLSFTRAVVRELRKRDRSLGVPSRLMPQTFDAFASRLLREHAPEGGAWERAGFDGRIEHATALVGAGAADETLDAHRHVLVDEVQDLVGVRAEFVAALLNRHDGGFTAFGDPAQAIYDHERGRHEDGFLRHLGDELADGSLEILGNHRSSGELAETIAALRATVLADNAKTASSAVKSVFLDLPTMGRFEALPEALSLSNGRVQNAVLCRDNATALSLSSALHKRGVAHRVRQSSMDRPVAGWVAALFGRSATLTKENVAERTGELSGRGFPGLLDLEESWPLLCRLDPTGGRAGAVRATEVGSRIATGRVPWELYDEPDTPLVISSVHRAKGLEFDNCMVVEWSPRQVDDEALEARVLFVALTRARRGCLQVERQATWQRWFRASDAMDRFIKRGREDWQTFGIEVRGDDVHDTEPVGASDVGIDAAAVQEALIYQVREGDSVTLTNSGERDFGSGRTPFYRVDVEEVGPVGITGARFGDALRGRLRSRDRPARITDVHVQDLETVKGSMDAGDAAGLGRSGLWLRPRLVGLGEFDWKT